MMGNYETWCCQIFRTPSHYDVFRFLSLFVLDIVLMRYYIIGMKKRDITPEVPLKQGLEALAQAFAALKNTADIKAFLQDLCTPAEMEALVDRWQVVPYVIDEMPYREIHEHTGVSVTTIGRVARTLHTGAGGYHAAVKRLGITKNSH